MQPLWQREQQDQMRRQQELQEQMRRQREALQQEERRRQREEQRRREEQRQWHQQEEGRRQQEIRRSRDEMTKRNLEINQKKNPIEFGKPVMQLDPIQPLYPPKPFHLGGSQQIPKLNPVQTVNPIAEIKSHPGRGILIFLLWLVVTLGVGLWVGAMLEAPGAMIIVWVLGLWIAIRAGQKARKGK